MAGISKAMASALCLLPVTLALAAGAAGGGEAGGRRLLIIDGADYFGHDYDTLRDATQSDCESACLSDQRCQAFTFNRNAGWCFLKTEHGELRAFDSAVSGRIVTGPVDADADRLARRSSELAFLSGAYRDEAEMLRDRVTNAGDNIDGTFDEVIAGARAAESTDPRRAARLYRVALRLAPDDAGLWFRLAAASLAVDTGDWSLRRQMQEQATAAAINGYLHAGSKADRVRALMLIGRSLEVRSAWRPAIRANRAALKLEPDPILREHLDQLIARHGFRVIDHSVSSDARDPRICVQFSDPLADKDASLADYVQLDQEGLAVEPEARQICIDGVHHGERYGITIRAGLPAGDGERLTKPVELDVYVRDRSPSVRFPSRAYVLPSGGEASLPIVSVNTELLDAALYRVGDRALGGFVAGDELFGQLSDYEAADIADRRGERLWQGQIEVRSELNKEVTTAVPVGALLAEAAKATGADEPDAMTAGTYILTAKPRDAGDDAGLATQWFVVSDLGLTTLAADDGLHAFVRSLSTAEPQGGVTLRLVALNQQVLGRAVTDDRGYARFEAGLLRGSGGNAPALLTAEAPHGDYGFLDMQDAPFDLTDRGVDGRPAPGPVDVYLVSERGIYRPGEAVTLTALTRDARARAVTGLPLTFIVHRPDGVEHVREQVPDQGLGGHRLTVPMLADAMRGTWSVQVHTDPDAEPLARLGFLVEDFQPERLDFTLTPSAERIDPQDPPDIAVDARWLYGAPAAAVDVEGTTRVQAADGLADWPGWRFGLYDDEVEDRSEPIPGAETDADGRARIGVALPELVPTSRLRRADVSVRVLDGSGRPAERKLALPIDDRRPRIGIRALFDGAVEQGGTARFEVIALGTDGRPIPAAGLTWTLSRVQTSYQWYQIDGDWRFEPIVSRSRAASGTFDVHTDDDKPSVVEVPVDWGGYELAVRTAGGRLVPASVGFEAGWYVAPKAFDTPDVLKVSLDQAEYEVGATARVRLEPRFPGLALVMVVGSDGLVAMEPVEVPEKGATVELPVTADWGPGAYITAMLYRGMDLEARRMPGRAIGLHWASVDPGDRRLDLTLDVAEKAEPRGPLAIGAVIDNLVPDSDAYVTIAAVDNGILNLTDFRSWAPAGWYFGQRRLGAAVRDLYGRLIDRMQGEPGRLRTGSGAGMLLSFDGPPPSEALVAFQSGILKADAQGRVETSLDVPDFNGSVRVMAMAWSADGVGQSVKDVILRDPVVVTAAMPRFLAPGDRSRILVELAHVEREAGTMQVSLTAGGPSLRIDGDGAPRTLELPANGRARVSYDVEAVTPGNAELTITLVTPAGKELTKHLVLGVRSLRPPVQRTTETVLEPGGDGLTLDASLLDADGGGFEPGSGAWLVSVSGAGALDVPGILAALDRFPYGCAEQLTSRALPLLYLDPVAMAAGLAGGGPGPGVQDGDNGDTVSQRIDSAIAGLLASQNPTGGFGLWGPGYSAATEGAGLWLDAYVTDFLTRAREQGYVVPHTAFDNALTNLRNRVGYAADFEHGGEGVAYALYVLARNGRVPMGDLRWYEETRLDAFETPMARAQLGAALALYGETRRAAKALRSALELWRDGDDGTDWRPDFGSGIRDGAALLTLAAESGSDAIGLDALAASLERDWARAEHTSTQDQAWLLLAAHALMQGAAQPQLRIDGESREGPFYRRLGEVDLAGEPLSIANIGDRAVTALVTATGIPLEPPPAGGNGYRIERSWYTLDGKPLEPAKVEQGTRMIVLLTITADRQRAARLIVDDPLPAGLEIDNPNLISTGAVDGLPWLDVVEDPSHVAFRTERFVAAVDRAKREPRRFQLAYAVRAVSPGVFAHPAATVADMYRPAMRGWTGSGEVVVVASEDASEQRD